MFFFRVHIFARWKYNSHKNGLCQHERVFIDFLSSLQVQMFAPNIDQMHVVNHLKGEPSQEKRNVLVESARLARGNIQDLSKLSAKDHDAVIFPGLFASLLATCFCLPGTSCAFRC